MNLTKKLSLMFILFVLILSACNQSQQASKPEAQNAPVQEQKSQEISTPKDVSDAKNAVEDSGQKTETASKTSSAKTVFVSIKGFKFSPQDMTVNVGDTVVWTNEDSAPHTVESSDGTLRSDQLSNRDTYSHTFTKVEKLDYKCGIHSSMHGSVTVQ